MNSLKLIGKKLSNKTRNENGQSGQDCSKLWYQFEVDKVVDSIPSRFSDTLYAVYYDYESDENGYFSYFIGYEVDMDATTPEGLDALIIPEQFYHVETAKGKMTDCISEAWEKIWNSELRRTFGYDLEVYDERSYNWEDAEIDIYLSVKPN